MAIDWSKYRKKWVKELEDGLQTLKKEDKQRARPHPPAPRGE
jgi:hypothetical protein